MILYIDNREPKEIINYLNFLNSSAKIKINIIIQQLDLGDYLIYDEINKKNIVIIERKSLNDLESSIKDGRYNEQSFRLNDFNIHNHNIYYLIEGSIINYKNANFKNSLYSSLFSLSYFKGFSVYNSLNKNESAELIYSFISKINKETGKSAFYNLNNTLVDFNTNDTNSSSEDNTITNNSNTNDKNTNNINANDTNANDLNYLKSLKTSKKSNITRENINIIMLMQIPNVSYQSATAIMEEYKTLKNLIYSLNADNNCLANLKIKSSNRKISKNIITSIKYYLLENVENVENEIINEDL